MSVKQLAKQLPLCGQQAVSTALKALSVAGHLRRVRCSVGAGDETRWVFRTFWSRTARDNEWWNTYLATEDRRRPQPPPHHAGSTRLTGSRSTCGAPGPHRRTAAAHPTRPRRPNSRSQPGRRPPPRTRPHRPTGPTGDHSPASAATTTGSLPSPPTTAPPRTPRHPEMARPRRHHRLPHQRPHRRTPHPGRLPRRPDPPPPHRQTATPTPSHHRKHPAPTRRLLVECTDCGRPGQPEALPDGLCRPATKPTPQAATPHPPTPLQIAAVRTHMANLRTLLKPV